jgi:putative ATP-dependent endonuclease of the OLD family
VFYGGKLLAQLSGEAPEEVESAVSVLRVNRNAAVLIDSDRSREEDCINASKQRIIRELENIQAFSWLTDGREIENYLPASAISHAAKPEARSIARFEDIRDLLDEIENGAGKRFERSKRFLRREP